MIKNHMIIIALIAFVFGLTACSGGSGGSSTTSSSPPPAVVAGSAVKGPVAGAVVQLFYFNNVGDLIEIVTTGATVTTDAFGAFSFPVNGEHLMGITSPLIVQATGGSMDGVDTTGLTLMAVIADPLPLTFSNVTLTSHLSVASSVSAGLLINEAQDIGAAPTLDDAEWFADLVESQLQVGLADDPADSQTPNGMFNYCIDQNMGLDPPPLHTDMLVMELIEYFVANLSSQSGILDGTMEDPGNPGTDIDANFDDIGTGGLAWHRPYGPQSFIIMNLASDVEYVENDGSDTASITATLMDATGVPYQDLSPVQMGLDLDVGAPGILLSAGSSAAQGKVWGTLTSDEAGSTGAIVIRADIELPPNPNNSSPNPISLNIAVQAVDFYVDTDGDGFSDGDEVLGWTCVIDEIGYGAMDFGNTLTTRSVTSDPNVYDTDNDGLSDYEEYQVQTDPRTTDTDGDGLTDYSEWNIWTTNPSSVDTDGDARGPNGDLAPASALFDGQELVRFRTSPSLQDTDGDGRTDFEEIFFLNRKPLVSDLPKLEMEFGDAVDVRLDVTYAEDLGQTTQYGTEMMKSETRSESDYDEHSMNISVETEIDLRPFHWGGKVKVTAGYGHKWATTTENSKTSQETHSKYTTDSRTRTETAATGSMSAGIRLRNPGDITYTLSKLGITVRHWEMNWDENIGQMVKSFQTVATLIPPLGSGITLAPGEETPVLQVEASDLNPDRVKELLRRPDSLYLEAAYFELENAAQVNFDFLMEINATRTASIVIDPGESNATEYRVATNVQRGFGGTYPGVTLGAILNDILEIDYATIERRHVEPGSPTNERVLFSLQGLETNLANSDQGFWVAIHESEHPSSGLYDFDNIPVRVGERVLLIYVRDDDGDGLNALEEQHYGTYAAGVDDESDTDEDGLDDYYEVHVGWDVEWFDSSGTRHFYSVLSDPASKDQDGDGWNDSRENDEGTNPSNPDTDRDGLPDSVDSFPLIQAKVLYVDQTADGNNDGTSWADACTDLQNALAEARTGNGTEEIGTDDVAEIWVARGVYMPASLGNRAVSFEMVDNLGVFGGFIGTETKRSQRNANPLINKTVLSGDLNSDDPPTIGDDTSLFQDNSHYVVRADTSVSQTGVLDGFLITGGFNEVSSGGGGVMYGLPTLRNLFFRVNGGRSGALFIVPNYISNNPSLTGDQTIDNCIFDSNMNTTINGGNGGGMCTVGSERPDDSKLILRNCIFRNNRGPRNGGGAVSDRGKNLFGRLPLHR